MRVESSVPSPFILFHNLSAKKLGRPRAHSTREGRDMGGEFGEGRVREMDRWGRGWRWRERRGRRERKGR